jgi:hypothetical protein
MVAQATEAREVKGRSLYLTAGEQYMISVLLRMMLRSWEGNKALNDTAVALFHKFDTPLPEGSNS